MGNQTQQVSVAQKLYSRPQMLIPAAVIGYMIYNKKTRKTALLGGGTFLMLMGLKTRSEGDDTLSKGFGNMALGIGGALIFFGLRKNK